MFDYIKTLFTKPMYQISFAEGVVMALVILALLGLCLAIFWLVFVEIPYIAQKVSKKRAIKKLETIKKENNDETDSDR